jgi:hypothetical protein
MLPELLALSVFSVGLSRHRRLAMSGTESDAILMNSPSPVRQHPPHTAPKQNHHDLIAQVMKRNEDERRFQPLALISALGHKRRF